MPLLRLPQRLYPLHGRLGPERAAERIAGIGGIRDDAATGQAVCGGTQQAGLRRFRMKHEPAAHASLWARRKRKPVPLSLAPLFAVPGMQLLFDFLPAVAFFVAYKLADIYVATAVIIVASLLQVSIHWLWKRRINPMHLVTAGLVLLFGGLTLLVHDKAFIM